MFNDKKDNEMKYRIIIIAAILSVVATSCKKDIEDLQENLVQTPIRISATYEGAKNTKVGYNEDGNSISATWQTGDQIKVVFDNHVSTLDLVSGEGTASATFAGTITGNSAPTANSMLICYVSDANAPGIVNITGDGSYTYTTEAFLSQDGSMDTAASRNLFYGMTKYGDGSNVNCQFFTNTSMMKFTVSAPDAVLQGSVGATLTYRSNGVDIARATFTVGADYVNTIYMSIPAGNYSGEQALVYQYDDIEESRVLSTSHASFTAGQTYSKDVAFSNAIRLDTLTVDYTAQNGDWLTGTLENMVKVTIAPGATVVLKNVSINADGRWSGDEYDGLRWPGIDCLGDATIVLADGTTSTVKGIKDGYAGISVAAGHTLTLRGPGTLNAIGGSRSAGIGASYSNESTGCGNIVIESGTINATGGSEYGAGIGNTLTQKCGDITITGGTVNATGSSEGAPGIGAGQAAGPQGPYCGKIIISGGTITATGGDYAAGIGNGNETEISAITITTGITRITATSGNYAANAIGPNGDGVDDENLCPRVKMGFAVMYKEGEWKLGRTGSSMAPGNYGHLTLAVSGNTWTLTPAASTGYTETRDITSGTITVPNGSYWRVTGATNRNNASTKNNRIIVEDGAMVMLSDLTIDGYYSDPSIEKAGVTCEGDAIVVLDGNNTVSGFDRGGTQCYPGIHIAVGYTLVIRGSGSLTASSSTWGAGIGGGKSLHCGNIRIEGGTINAIGGSGAAGIGGGKEASCGDITITSGVTSVIATKGSTQSPAAGIGAGYNGTCGTVTIEPGANVTQN